jgi:cytosine/adenosine deaminase-related metal-dependent hydrolase
MILRARVVLPLSQPPIDDGAVVISGGRIRGVGRWRDLAATPAENTFDLGESVLLPGLVNAHCHLDYTGLAGQIAPPKSFADWIKALVALKAGWDYSDFAQSWLHGAKMLLRSGVTTVADIEAVPVLLPEVSESTPLRVISFLEMISFKSSHSAREMVQTAVAKLKSLPREKFRGGLSPHAPYTTGPELLQLASSTARQKKLRLTMHVAESAEEFDMFCHRRGRLFDWLKSQRDMSDCGLSSPVRHLDRHGMLADNLLAVHVNYLADDDANLLSKRGVSVAHCPRSHAYFRHQRFPLEELTSRGVNVCLGTDSLVSMAKIRRRQLELNMFSEMQSLAANAPALAPERILRMATINAAKALGLAKRIGEISNGALADVIVIPFAAKKKSVYEAVVNHSEAVAGSMIAGQWAVEPEIG